MIGHNKIIIQVDCEPGEENMSISDITDQEFWTLDNVLQAIRARGGYYPTGDFLEFPDPVELYSTIPGYDILERILPKPVSGFRKILEVSIIPGPLNTLYM